jgi:hypothetical protein
LGYRQGQNEPMPCAMSTVLRGSLGGKETGHKGSTQHSHMLHGPLLLGRLAERKHGKQRKRTNSTKCENARMQTRQGNPKSVL